MGWVGEYEMSSKTGVFDFDFFSSAVLTDRFAWLGNIPCRCTSLSTFVVTHSLKAHVRRYSQGHVSLSPSYRDDAQKKDREYYRECSRLVVVPFLIQ
jgi:hypothetical protein